MVQLDEGILLNTLLLYYEEALEYRIEHNDTLRGCYMRKILVCGVRHTCG